MRKYIDYNDNTYRTNLVYSVNGYGRSRVRGYYLTVTPVKINTDDDGLIMSERTLFDGSEYSLGKSILLNEVGRKSKKQEQIALDMLTDEYLMSVVKDLDKLKPESYNI